MAGTSFSGADYWSRETLLYREAHPRLRFMARQLARLPGRRLLDVGCSVAALRDLLPADFKYFGCDITDHAAGRLPEGHFARIDFNERADLSCFAGRELDAIHLGGVLEYLHRPGELLAELRRLVPAGAPMLSSLINFEGRRYRDAARHHRGWVYKPTLEALLEEGAAAGWAAAQVWPFSEKRGVPGRWFRTWARLLGPDHAWVRREARQLILFWQAA